MMAAIAYNIKKALKFKQPTKAIAKAMSLTDIGEGHNHFWFSLIRLFKLDTGVFN